MSFFLVLGQVGFLRHVYLSTLHESFDCHKTSHETIKKTKTIHVEYAGSGKYVDTLEVGLTTTFHDVIPNHHVAFQGHNGPEIHNLSSLQDQDTITIRKRVFRGELSHTLEHNQLVQSITWNSNGMLASGSYRTIKIWDSTTWKCIQTLGGLEGHTHYVNSVAWNAQGTQLASGSSDKTIKIWDTKTWKCIQTLGHTGYVMSVAWNSQGRLASGSYDTIKIWDSKDSKTWKCVQTLEGHTLYVSSVAWNSQGTLLASGSEDNMIKIWDSKTWKCIHTLGGHIHYVSSVAWNSQGTLLASGSWDKTIKIWNTITWKCVQTLKGHISYVNSIAWDSRGTKLVSGSNDKTIKIWNTKSWEFIQTLEGHTQPVISVACNDQGTVLASGSTDYTIKIWK